MAQREILLPWDSQPQEAVELSDHPSARGVIGLWNAGAGPTGAVGGSLTPYYIGSAGIAVSQGGLAFAGDGTANGRWSLPDLSSLITTEATLLLLVAPKSTANQGFAYFSTSTNTTNSDHYPYSGLIYSSIFKADRWVNGVSPQIPFTDMPPHCVTVQFKNGSQRYAQGGRTVVTASYAVNPVIPSNARLLVSENTGQIYLGSFPLVVLWNRYLPDDEINALARDVVEPYQLFAPRSIWVPVSAGGGAATHATTGVLTGAGSTVAGTAAHKAKHATTGVLTGPGSAVVGSAARTRQHPTSGALTGAGSTVVGTAAHKAKHATTGVLTGQGSAVVGSAARTRQHPSSGALVGPGSAVVGVAAHVVAGGPHATTGALVGPGSAVVGTAAHVAKHATSGVLVGLGSVIEGVAARVAGAVTHATSGVLVGAGSVISGVARGPLPDVVSSGGGGWLPKMRRKTRKQIHEERIKLGILPPDVVKAAKKAAAVVADEPSPVQAYRQDPQEANKVFLRSLGAPQMTPDYTRAIQAQIKIQQDEEEDLMLFM